jgi:hypothetical protein
VTSTGALVALSVVALVNGAGARAADWVSPPMGGTRLDGHFFAVAARVQRGSTLAGVALLGRRVQDAGAAVGARVQVANIETVGTNIA